MNGKILPQKFCRCSAGCHIDCLSNANLRKNHLRECHSNHEIHEDLASQVFSCYMVEDDSTFIDFKDSIIERVFLLKRFRVKLYWFAFFWNFLSQNWFAFLWNFETLLITHLVFFLQERIISGHIIVLHIHVICIIYIIYVILSPHVIVDVQWVVCWWPIVHAVHSQEAAATGWLHPALCQCWYERSDHTGQLSRWECRTLWGKPLWAVV